MSKLALLGGQPAFEESLHTLTRSGRRLNATTAQMLFDDPSYADIPVTVIQAALSAEGVVAYEIEGPMYRHMLWNVEPEAYRVDRPCLVTEHTRAHGLIMFHGYLGRGRTEIEKIADAVEKVASNANALRAYASRSETFDKGRTRKVQFQSRKCQQFVAKLLSNLVRHAIVRRCPCRFAQLIAGSIPDSRPMQRMPISHDQPALDWSWQAERIYPEDFQELF